MQSSLRDGLMMSQNIFQIPMQKNQKIGKNLFNMCRSFFRGIIDKASDILLQIRDRGAEFKSRFWCPLGCNKLKILRYVKMFI